MDEFAKIQQLGSPLGAIRGGLIDNPQTGMQPHRPIAGHIKELQAQVNHPSKSLEKIYAEISNRISTLEMKVG